MSQTDLERKFDAALAQWDTENLPAPDRTARRALFAAWWFLENGNVAEAQQDAGRADVFFRVREIAREVVPATNTLSGAVEMLDAATGDGFWILAKGRNKPTEPLFAAALYDGNPGSTVAKATAEADTLHEAIAGCLTAASVAEVVG